MGSSQKKAVQAYRSRLGARGLARFEVMGCEADRALIRALARRLAESGPEAARLREAVSERLAGAGAETGGIVAALRRSPLVGADMEIGRVREGGRDVTF